MESQSSPEKPKEAPQAIQTESTSPQRESILRRILNSVRRREVGQSAPVEASKEGRLRGALLERFEKWNDSLQEEERQLEKRAEETAKGQEAPKSTGPVRDYLRSLGQSAIVAFIVSQEVPSIGRRTLARTFTQTVVDALKREPTAEQSSTTTAPSNNDTK